MMMMIKVSHFDRLALITLLQWSHCDLWNVAAMSERNQIRVGYRGCNANPTGRLVEARNHRAYSLFRWSMMMTVSHTYLQELSARPHKQPEAEQKVLFIWENLCQLDKE